MQKRLLNIIEKTQKEVMFNDITNEFLEKYYEEIRSLKEDLMNEKYSNCQHFVKNLKVLSNEQIESIYGEINMLERIFINSHLGKVDFYRTIFSKKQLPARKYLYENYKNLEIILAEIKKTEPNM
jgi:hypothetical protein